MAGEQDRRALVGAALAEVGLGWDAWPQVLADDRLTPEVKLRGLLVLLEEIEPARRAASYAYRVDQPDHSLDEWGRPREPWRRLRRLRLPWTAAAATAALVSVTRARAYDERAVTLALRGAQQVAKAGLADVALLDTLDSCVARLETVTDGGMQADQTLIFARRVVAMVTPPDLLDLSLLVEGDAWAAGARRAAARAPAEQVTPLVRLLSELGPRRPSQRWAHAVARALDSTDARAMLRRWLELAADTDVVSEVGGHLGESRGTLFVGTNSDLVRAAVWATSLLSGQDWPSALLGVLARRGSAHNGARGLPEALSLKVATASVDALIARGGAADRRVLAELSMDLSRKDLLAKVAAALNHGVEPTAHGRQLRRDGTQSRGAGARAAPRQARATVDSLLRASVGPELRATGFVGGPRIWRRLHDDRVDVISIDIGPDARDEQAWRGLTFGTRYDVAHPGDEPRPLDRARVRGEDLDVRLCEVSPDGPALQDSDIGDHVRHLREVVVPFLDTLGRYERAKAVLERGVGLPTGLLEDPGGSTRRIEALGMLALAAGDTATALPHLRTAYSEAKLWLEHEVAVGDEGAVRTVAYWADKVERAERRA